MNTTVSSTPDWTKRLLDAVQVHDRMVGIASIRVRRWLGAWIWCLLVWCLSPAWAQSVGPAAGSATLPESAASTPAVHQGPSLKELRIDRSADGVALSVQLDLTLPSGVEDVLLKSVPIYFVMQADVFRERWYWSDQRVSRRARTYRLAYQPLTRQWRLSMATGAGPGASLDYALHQNHASLVAALSAMSRLNNWPVADAPQLPADGALWVDFRFSLDPALLPRPFQFGSTSGEWGLDLRRRLPVPPQVASGQSSPEAGRE